MRALRARLVSTIVLGVAACSASCRSLGGIPTEQQVGDRIKERTGQSVRASGEPSLPPNASLDDGLTQEEAVAIALWNNAGFQRALVDLGIARADVAAAGLLRNPVLTLLLPWGPKQLEATAKLPLDAIWQRPRRLAAARAGATAVAERLVAGALTLVADTRLAFVDLAIANRRVALAAEQLQLGQRMADLARRRSRPATLVNSTPTSRRLKPRAPSRMPNAPRSTSTWPATASMKSSDLAMPRRRRR